MAQSNQPETVLRDGFLKVTVWKNAGDKGDYYTASPAKNYEKDGKLVDGNSFSDSDLLKLSELCRLAYAHIKTLRAKAKAENSYEMN